MRGIIMAGGHGTRLYPATASINKHLLPVYDKPMIYYPFSTLLLAGVDQFLIIARPDDEADFASLFGDGSKFGVTITYATQTKPNGIADAFLIGCDFIGNNPVSLVLGDNVFYGPDFGRRLTQWAEPDGAHIFGAQVDNPVEYGVLEFNDAGRVTSIEEKPMRPKSRYAVPGLYFYSADVVDKARSLVPSARGELEITDVNRAYLAEGRLSATMLSRGNAWLDTGTAASLDDAATFVRAVENRQGLKIGCPEEIAWRIGRIDNQQLFLAITQMPNSPYRAYLEGLLATESD